MEKNKSSIALTLRMCGVSLTVVSLEPDTCKTKGLLYTEVRDTAKPPGMHRQSLKQRILQPPSVPVLRSLE
jgi:hypothetical protein